MKGEFQVVRVYGTEHDAASGPWYELEKVEGIDNMNRII